VHLDVEKITFPWFQIAWFGHGIALRAIQAGSGNKRDRTIRGDIG
jgi:hypothetical protein